jgi:hypothetical protein
MAPITDPSSLSSSLNPEVPSLLPVLHMMGNRPEVLHSIPGTMEMTSRLKPRFEKYGRHYLSIDRASSCSPVVLVALILAILGVSFSGILLTMLYRRHRQRRRDEDLLATPDTQEPITPQERLNYSGVGAGNGNGAKLG